EWPTVSFRCQGRGSQHHTEPSGRWDGSCAAAAFGAGVTASDARASSLDSASPFLNWASAWPSDRNNSGSFFALKKKIIGGRATHTTQRDGHGTAPGLICGAAVIPVTPRTTSSKSPSSQKPATHDGSGGLALASAGSTTTAANSNIARETQRRIAPTILGPA